MNYITAEPAAIVQQGSQFYLECKIKNGTADITPLSCSDVWITLGGKTKKLSAGEVTWLAETQAWLYPLTEAETLNLAGFVEIQAKYSVGADVFVTRQKLINFSRSINREEMNASGD